MREEETFVRLSYFLDFNVLSVVWCHFWMIVRLVIAHISIYVFMYAGMQVFLLSHVSTLCLLVYQHDLGSTIYYAEYMQSQCGQMVSITH